MRIIAGVSGIERFECRGKGRREFGIVAGPYQRCGLSAALLSTSLAATKTTREADGDADNSFSVHAS